MKQQSRRVFLRNLSVGAATLVAQPLLASCGVKPAATLTASTETQAQTQATLAPTPEVIPDMLVARGDDPEKMVRQGIQALGGMGRFMKQGADVIIKPNICVGYNTYEYASTTNPFVVAALVRMCIEAGAKRVRVMDFPFGSTAEQAYRYSGIGDAVEAAGGEMEVMTYLKYIEVDIPNAIQYKKATIYEDILKTDLLINVPIAKHHSMAKLTLGLKNLMGTIQAREKIHASFEKSLVDLATLVRPQLTVIDAIRTLMDHGPTGGSLDDVKIQNTLIFSPDIVAADSYATRLFDMGPQDVPYILAAAVRGLGKADLSGLNIQEISVNA